MRAHRDEGSGGDLQALFDAIHYREFKILLKREAFLGVDFAEPVHDFWKRAKRVAEETGVEVDSHRGWREYRHRDVTFLDTHEGGLYGGSWILRLRADLRPHGETMRTELTCKFRGPDPHHVSGSQVACTAPLDGVVKLKEELLLVEDHLGGMRSIYSHGCQLKDWTHGAPKTVGAAAKIFPGLAASGLPARAALSRVGTRRIEEVLYDLGGLDFGRGRYADASVAVWRDVASGEPLIGEFSYETHFQHYGRLHPKEKTRSERFYRLLQREAGSWVELGATKTALVYQMAGRRTSHRE